MQLRVVVSLFLVVLTLGVCSAEWMYNAPLFGFTGDWAATGKVLDISFDSYGNCSTSSSSYTYSYVTFNINFPTAGVRKISSLSSFQSVYAYKNTNGMMMFNASNPCQGNPMKVYQDEYDTDYSWESYTYYEAGNWTFLVLGYYSYGGFGGDLTEGWQFETRNDTSANGTGEWWYPVYTSSNGDCYTDDSYASYYKVISITVNQTNYYDINSYFAHVEEGNYPTYNYIALYKGTPNASVFSDGCGSYGAGVSLVDAQRFYYYRGELVNVYLQQGQVYTAIVSAYNSYNFFGKFGFEVVYTRRATFTLPVGSTSNIIGGFNEPRRDDDYYGYPGANCAQNTGDYNNRPYTLANFPVPPNTNFTIYTTEPHDYEFFTYTDRNANPPTACIISGRYIDYRDSGSTRTIGPVDTDEYTVVVTPYFTSSDDDVDGTWYTDIYVHAGVALTSSGVPVTTTTTTTTTTRAPVTSTTTTTTRAPVTTTSSTAVPVTTSTSTTTTTTTRAPTTSTSMPVTTSTSTTTTTRTPTTTTTTKAPSTTGGTSDATTYAVSVALVLVCVFAMLF